MPKGKRPESTPKLLKDYIDGDLAEAYLQPFGLNTKQIRLIEKDFLGLALKDRVKVLTEALHQNASTDFKKSLIVLRRIVLNENLTGLKVWPALDFIERFGLENWESSMEALEFFTVHFTAEFAIRAFLLKDFERAYQQMLKWSKSDNAHLRRLASEGFRPYLPWGKGVPQILASPKYAWPLLDPLVQDSSSYVRKSVANHLNDLSRKHPDAVLDFLKRHQRNQRNQEQASFKFIERHGLRTLIKKGYGPALRYFKVKPGNKYLSFKNFKVLHKALAIGESTELNVQIVNQSQTSQKFVLDYRVDFYRPGSKKSVKVFKWAVGELGPKETKILRKKVTFKQASVRSLYPGPHKIEILLNGTAAAGAQWVIQLR